MIFIVAGEQIHSYVCWTLKMTPNFSHKSCWNVLADEEDMLQLRSCEDMKTRLMWEEDENIPVTCREQTHQTTGSEKHKHWNTSFY